MVRLAHQRGEGGRGGGRGVWYTYYIDIHQQRQTNRESETEIAVHNPGGAADAHRLRQRQK